MKVFDNIENILRKDLLRNKQEVDKLKAEVQDCKDIIETRTILLFLVSVYSVLVTFNLFL
jgi:hypothetical protein